MNKIKSTPSKKAKKARQRKAMLEAQFGLCFWCGKPLTCGGSFDHIIPKKLGGSDKPENICLAHVKCNNEKGHYAPSEYILMKLKDMHAFMKSDGFQRYARTK